MRPPPMALGAPFEALADEQLAQCASWEGQVRPEVGVREALHEYFEELVGRSAGQAGLERQAGLDLRC